VTKRIDVPPVPGADIQIGLLLAMLDDGTTDWREELSAVSDEMVVWQPFPGGHSIGAIILHIADVEAHWLHQIGAGQSRSEEELARLLSQETQQYDLSWPRPPAQPLSWFLAQHDEIRARTRQIVSTWNDPALVRFREDTEFTRRWLLHHVLTHEAYHGGQAVLLSILHGRR
jgi:uncharacterized damage-inducible protein DinB